MQARKFHMLDENKLVIQKGKNKRLSRSKKKISPKWRARREDRSYNFESSIRRTKGEKS